MRHFLDIGSHHGETFDFLITLKRDFSDYHFWVFEPSPRHFNELLAACLDNRQNYQINVCPFGIAGETGIRRFFEKDDAMGDSLKEVHASDHTPKNIDSGYKVYSAVVGLSEFILDFTSPGDELILDIDAEGAEYEILTALARGTMIERVKEIWVEWHHIPDRDGLISPQQFAELCQKRGIKLVNRGDPALCSG